MGGKNLLQRTIERVSLFDSPAILAAGGEEHRFLIAEVFQNEGVHGQVLLEPSARNTTAAMAF